MSQLQHMAVFAAVAEAQSFAGGARKLRMSAPAVTRAVAALERKLRVKLLTRSTRHVRVTDAGLRFLADTRRILADVQAAEDAARGINAAPAGTLTMTAPVIFGRKLVMPIVTEFLERYPETSVTALFDDRVANLLEEGVDVAIRIGELKDSALNAVQVGWVRRVLCAARSYLKVRGEPKLPGELSSHSIIGAATVAPTTEWHFAGKPGIVRIKPRLIVSNNDAAIVACEKGLGITRLFSYQVAEGVQEDRLRIILPDFELAPLPVHVVYRGGRQAAASVRAFVEIATSQLKETPLLAKRA
jgi:DNA-binding transcriptional LysR family regulator